MLGEKGEKIRFVKGNYKGLAGWVDKSKKKGTPRKKPVIVHNKDGSEHQTKVERASYRAVWGTPKSYGEAAIQQNPDMEQHMIRFCELYVACGCRTEEAAIHLLTKELQFAFSIQQKLGHKAECRRVEFEIV